MQLASDARTGQRYAIKFIRRGNAFDVKTISRELMNQVRSSGMAALLNGGRSHSDGMLQNGCRSRLMVSSDNMLSFASAAHVLWAPQHHPAQGASCQHSRTNVLCVLLSFRMLLHYHEATC